MTTPAPHVRQYLLTKRAAQLWIEATLGETLLKDEDFFVQLVDGVTLCKVMQRISPSMIPRIKIPALKRRASNHLFKTNENVRYYLLFGFVLYLLYYHMVWLFHAVSVSCMFYTCVLVFCLFRLL